MGQETKTRLMSSAKTRKKNPWPAFHADSQDGRRQRSDRSRRKIIEAMFALLREGNMSPTAVEVAGFYDRFRFRDAVVATMNLARAANKYFNDREPWKRRS